VGPSSLNILVAVKVGNQEIPRIEHPTRREIRGYKRYAVRVDITIRRYGGCRDGLEGKNLLIPVVSISKGTMG
jgi:hypothetical protein